MSTEQSSLDKVRDRVEETKDIMHDNIETMIETQRNIDVLGEKSKRVMEESKKFKKSATRVRRNEQYRFAMVPVVCAVLVMLWLGVRFYIENS